MARKDASLVYPAGDVRSLHHRPRPQENAVALKPCAGTAAGGPGTCGPVPQRPWSPGATGTSQRTRYVLSKGRSRGRVSAGLPSGLPDDERTRRPLTGPARERRALPPAQRRVCERRQRAGQQGVSPPTPSQRPACPRPPRAPEPRGGPDVTPGSAVVGAGSARPPGHGGRQGAPEAWAACVALDGGGRPGALPVST